MNAEQKSDAVCVLKDLVEIHRALVEGVALGKWESVTAKQVALTSLTYGFLTKFAEPLIEMLEEDIRTGQ